MTTTPEPQRLRHNEPSRAVPSRATPSRSAAPAPRRYRQTIVKVDLWTVIKLSLCFYISAMFVLVVALVALWVFAEAAGIIGNVEKFLGDLFSDKSFTFLSAQVLQAVMLIGLLFVALQVVITAVAVSFYNIFAGLFGGLEVTIKEEDPQGR